MFRDPDTPLNSTIVRILGDTKPGKSAGSAPYPGDLDRRVDLRDGHAVRVRPIRPDDEPRLVALFDRLSSRSVYQRFFTTYRRLPDAWYRAFANVDYRTRLALVAQDVAEPEVLHGVARWEPGESPDAVELALVVEDAWQGRGLGGALFESLLAAARARGIDLFCADVLAENARMLELLRRHAAIRAARTADGVVHVCFGPAPGVAPERGVA